MRPVEKQDALAIRLKLSGAYPAEEGLRHYNVANVKTGFGLMFGAGAISGLLGIGSGALKVIAMDQAMRIPFKVSTTTSNFMIGVTAAASAGIYLQPRLYRSWTGHARDARRSGRIDAGSTAAYRGACSRTALDLRHCGGRDGGGNDRDRAQRTL